MVKDFTLFLSALENNEPMALPSNYTNWMCSFYYLRKWRHDDIIEFLERWRGRSEQFFLDSGAFSFQSAANFIAGRTNMNKTELSVYEILRYTYQYLEFINVYGKYFDLIAEIDLDWIVGPDATRYLYDILRRCEDEQRDKLVPVWHIPRGDSMWNDDLKTHKHVGIEGHSRHKDDPISFYNQMIATAEQAGTKVHAFAMTSETLLQRIPFDSVDSASWVLVASMGGIKTPWGLVQISDKRLAIAETDEVYNYATFSPMEQKVIADYLADMGFTIEECSNHWRPRARANIIYYQRLAEKINKYWTEDRRKAFQESAFGLEKWTKESNEHVY